MYKHLDVYTSKFFRYFPSLLLTISSPEIVQID